VSNPWVTWTRPPSNSVHFHPFLQGPISSRPRRPHGKTAAFALPLLSLLGKHQPGIRTLVLEPTRELAAQVEDGFPRLRPGYQLEHRRRLWRCRLWPAAGDDQERGRCPCGHPGAAHRFPFQPGNQSFRAQAPDPRRDGPDARHGFHAQVRRSSSIAQRCARPCFSPRPCRREIEGMTSWVLHEPEVIEIGIRTRRRTRSRTALYPVAREQKFEVLLALLAKTDFFQRPHLLPHQGRRRPDRAPAQGSQALRRGAAFQPHPA